MVIKVSIIFISLTLFIAQSAYATAYYVDSEHGNDSWTGKAPTLSGNSSVDSAPGRHSVGLQLHPCFQLMLFISPVAETGMKHFV